MPRRKAAAEGTEFVCSKCGTEISGPDADDVAATVKRHNAAKHKTARAKKSDA